MVLGKVKPVATIVAQFAAGVEVEAIQHEGKMFFPVVNVGEFKVDAPETTSRTAEPTSTKAPKGGKKSSDEEETTSYTEEELMETDTKELLKICKKLGIDPDKTSGKNTNKKLRNLILDAQENGAGSEEEDDDDDKGGENDELHNNVSEILEDFDGGKKNKKKTISALCALGDDVDKDAVTELVEEFEDDADADIDETADKIVAVINGEEPEEDEDDDEEEKKPKKKGGKKSKEELVDVDDLEVGDRVSVWWDDDNKDWFDGEVKSISKKGKVVIAYDDDTEEPIDPEIHTKIKRI